MWYHLQGFVMPNWVQIPHYYSTYNLYCYKGTSKVRDLMLAIISNNPCNCVPVRSLTSVFTCNRLWQPAVACNTPWSQFSCDTLYFFHSNLLIPTLCSHIVYLSQGRGLSGFSLWSPLTSHLFEHRNVALIIVYYGYITWAHNKCIYKNKNIQISNYSVNCSYLYTKAWA